LRRRRGGDRDRELYDDRDDGDLERDDDLARLPGDRDERRITSGVLLRSIQIDREQAAAKRKWCA